MYRESRRILFLRGRCSSLYPTLRQRRRPQTFILKDRWRSGTRFWMHCGSSLFLSNFTLKVPFSLVQPSSHLTLCLYAKRSAHPDILIGTHEMLIPLASRSGSFCLELHFGWSIEHLACRYPLYSRERRWRSCAVNAAGHTVHVCPHYTSQPVQQPPNYTNQR